MSHSRAVETGNREGGASRGRSVHRGWPGSAAVIGAGTMGLGMAESFAAAGTGARLTDAPAELTRQAKEQLVERTREHAEAGRNEET